MANKKYPASIKHLDFSKLRGSQVWTLSDWMGGLHKARSFKTEVERKAWLKSECEANPTRAQEGYEVIVLCQSPSSAQPTTDHEKRFLEMAASVCHAAIGDVDHKALEFVKHHAANATSDFTKLAKRALEEAAEKVAPLVIKDGGKTRKVKGALPNEFKRMVELGAARKNIMLVGPAGCGKTFLAEKLAEALNLNFADQSCSAGLSESAFTGWLLPVGKAGQFSYVSSPFINIYENGGVFLFDEMDAADANLLTFLNKALANTSFHLPQRHGKTLVKRHKDFVAVGACNTFGHGADAMYVGRNQLDAATLDRFRVGMVMMDYSSTVEEAIIDHKVLEWGRNIRKQIRAKSLRRVMSTRTMKDMTDMVNLYEWKEPDWDAAYFADWTKEERSLISSATN